MTPYQLGHVKRAEAEAHNEKVRRSGGQPHPLKSDHYMLGPPRAYHGLLGKFSVGIQGGGEMAVFYSSNEDAMKIARRIFHDYQSIYKKAGGYVRGAGGHHEYFS